MITSEQVRAARAMLRWSSKDLADAANVGIATVKRLELMAGVPNGQTRILDAIRRALEGAGIEFVGAPEDGPGVRLRLTQRLPEPIDSDDV